jgi:hypothetical protein
MNNMELVALTTGLCIGVPVGLFACSLGLSLSWIWRGLVSLKGAAQDCWWRRKRDAENKKIDQYWRERTRNEAKGVINESTRKDEG